MKITKHAKFGVALPLIGAGMLFLGACGGGVSDSSTEPEAPDDNTSVPDDQADASDFTPATDGNLTLYTWSDYYPEHLAEKFREETGINLTVDYYDSNETLYAKLAQTGGTGYDVVVPSDYMVDLMREEGMLLEFDSQSLPNGKNIKPEFLDVYFDQDRKFSTPYLYGTTAFIYDSAVIPEDEAPTSWADYFNPPASAGKIGVFNDQVEVISAALRVVGGEDCTTDPEKLQAVQDLLTDFKPKVATINSDGIIERVSDGQQSMAMIWNGASFRVTEARPTAVYVYPSEGLNLWQDNFVIPAGAENVDQAKTFLNWMLEPENIAEATNFQGYNSGIEGTEPFIEQALRDSPAVVIPEQYVDLARPIPPCDNEATNNYSQIWNRFKS